MLLQFKVPEKQKVDGRIVLAGDIGATKSRLALFKTKGNELASLAERNFVTAQHKNITELIKIFLKETGPPDVICFGVAGPVMNGHAKLSNIQWEVNSRDLARCFKKKVHILNDLEANAYGLAMLHEKDVAVIHPGSTAITGNAAIISPGTGLGEAGIYCDGKYYHPFATEGGHCDFASRDKFDFELLTFLQRRFGHVSWERLISGPGIINIYTFLRDEKQMHEDPWLKKKMKGYDAASIVSGHINQSELCDETMHHFIRYLAYESANLVLKFKATRGLFIGGGIAPQIISLFRKENFSSFFCQSGRLNYILEKVPVKVISNPKAALLGAAWFAMRNYLIVWVFSLYKISTLHI